MTTRVSAGLAVHRSASFHVSRANHACTAGELVRYLGEQALGCAVDHEIEAVAHHWPAASVFWNRVCLAVVKIQSDAH